MAIEKVKTYFREYGMEEKIQEFDVSSATVELAAKALHCEPERIAKTLSFLVEEQAVLIVAAGDAKIDNAKYKAKFVKRQKCSQWIRWKHLWVMRWVVFVLLQ